MSLIINTFFDKDNVIYSNSKSNMGRNPIVELFYGNQFSRYLIHFDETRLKSLYLDGSFDDLSSVRHTLNLFNCGSIESELINGEYNSRIRGVSFDLVVYPLQQEFDEGVGYDYELDNYIHGDKLISVDPSNWFNATTLTNWNTFGATDLTGTTIIDSFHFDWGNENPSFDITNYLNSVITGGTENYGLVIQFPNTYENLTTDIEQYVGFFSRHTHTFFEPYVQTTYSNTIKDDRNKFYLNKINRLYLYCNIGGELHDLDLFPTCKIENSSGEDVLTPIVYKSGKGVYYVEFSFSDSDYDSGVMFYDIWSNIQYKSKLLKNIELEFTTRNQNIYFNIGDDFELPKKYNLSISGIRPSENINRGEIRKLIVSVRIPYTTNQSDIIDGLFYRLYIKEGLGETTIIDYTEINRCFKNNYFLIDTLSLVSHTYFIDIKLINNETVNNYKEVTYFTIVNETDKNYI